LYNRVIISSSGPPKTTKKKYKMGLKVRRLFAGEWGKKKKKD